MREAQNTEGFFWATQARGVEKCVWEQAACSEWATADGHAAATILCDLLKAFDHVAFQKADRRSNAFSGGEGHG